MLFHLEKIFIATTIIFLTLSPAANAEWKLEKRIGGWEVERDADAIFGTVGSRMITRATNVPGDYKLVLRCENNLSDIYVLLNEQLFSRTPRTKFIEVIYKFGTRQNLTSKWIYKPEEGNRIYFNDTRENKAKDREYMALLKLQTRNSNINQNTFIDLLASDNIWFTWRLSTFDTFAVLIHGDRDFRLLFDTTGTAEATKLMFTLCGQPNFPAVWLQEYSYEPKKRERVTEGVEQQSGSADAETRRLVGTYEFQRVEVPSGNQGGQLKLSARRKCFAFLPHGEDGSSGMVQMATAGGFVVATNKSRWSPTRARVFWYDDYGQGCRESYQQLLIAHEVDFLNQYQNDVQRGRADPVQIATLGQRDNPNAPLEQGVQQLGREIEKGVEDVTNEIGKVLRNIFK
ncbi:MAG: hypothetical protein KDJ90_20430 [Nitratireductor sp.]|nr:hypothetical protein [Nitratireductor sp.]